MEVTCPRELFSDDDGEASSSSGSGGGDLFSAGSGGESEEEGRGGEARETRREREVRRYASMGRGELRRCLDLLAPLRPTLRVLRLPEHNLAPAQLRALLDAFPDLDVLEAGLLSPWSRRSTAPGRRGDALDPSLMLDLYGATKLHQARAWPSVGLDALDEVEAVLADPRLQLHSIVLRHLRPGDAPRRRALALVRSIARLLADPSQPLRVLDLHDCRLWDGACEMVALAARHSRLAVLKLGHNRVGLDAAAALALAAQQCTSLQVLLLNATGIEPHEVDAVRHAFGQRPHYLAGDHDVDPDASDDELELVN